MLWLEFCLLVNCEMSVLLLYHEFVVCLLFILDLQVGGRYFDLLGWV